MAVTVEFYRDVWHGAFDGEDSELTLLLNRAADIIDNAIFLSGMTISKIPEDIADRVYKAVCAQADYIDSNGGVEAMNENEMASVSLGKFSYSGGASAAEAAAASPCTLCRQAIEYLRPTGLLNRGVAVI